MKAWKLYLCAGLFVLVTALKLLLPGQALALRETLHSLVLRGGDYGQMAEALGRRLSEDDPLGSLIEAFRGEGLAPARDRGETEPGEAEARP